MRPAIGAGLMILLEAAGPYMRPVLAVSKLTRLSKSWSRAPTIGKPAHERVAFGVCPRTTITRSSPVEPALSLSNGDG